MVTITLPMFDSPVLRVLLSVFLMILTYKLTAYFINPVNWAKAFLAGLSGFFS